MPDRFILSPSFIGEPAPSLGKLAGNEWRMNAPTFVGGDPATRMAPVHRGLRQEVIKAIREGARPVCIGGDCCAAIGVAAGLQQSGLSPALLWLDAHGDFNTWETTPSGFIGGMPLAMLVGRGEQSLLQVVGAVPMQETDVVLSDARDLDAAERALLIRSSVTHVERLADVPDALRAGRPLWVHLDTDVLDPADAPAMKYGAPNGPRLEEIHALADKLAKTGNVAAVSCTVWDMPNDKDGRTGAACLEVLRAILG